MTYLAIAALAHGAGPKESARFSTNSVQVALLDLTANRDEMKSRSGRVNPTREGYECLSKTQGEK